MNKISSLFLKLGYEVIIQILSILLILGIISSFLATNPFWKLILGIIFVLIPGIICCIFAFKGRAARKSNIEKTTNIIGTTLYFALGITIIWLFIYINFKRV